MKYVCQFSGGVGSFAAAKYVADNFPKRDITLLFCDTKEEDDSTYSFLHESAAYLGLEVTVIADGRRIWELFRDRRIIGNSQHDTCSETLKRNLAKSYIKKNYDSADTLLVFGIDWMEKHREPGITKRWAPFNCFFPLFDCVPDFDKNRFMKQCVEEFGLTLPDAYGMGFSHSNCGNFCVKAGKAHFLKLLDLLPERYAYHEEQEQIMQAYLEKPYTILRESRQFRSLESAMIYFMMHPHANLFWLSPITRKFIKWDWADPFTEPSQQARSFKVTRYLSMKELRERAEEIRQTEEGQEDVGGCGCHA